MKPIKNFNELIAHLEQRGTRGRVAVVWASDSSTQLAVCKALEHAFVDAIFVGCRNEIEQNKRLMAHSDHITFVEASDKDEAAAKAVALIREKQADILMKGMINTDNLLRCVLNKETGIIPAGRVLTHITAAFLPQYPKMLCFTDSAVIPYPTQQQREMQVSYISYVCHALGIEEPRIALTHCSEKVQEKHFPFTAGYQEIIEKARAGAYGKCIVDGPMDVKTACSRKNMLEKGLSSPIDGEADALIFPDIEAGNMFYKTITLFCNAATAAILQGPLCPVVMPSRADNHMAKYYSLALAAL
ncbi:MAG: phosphate butyryltransferase [Prevotella sp.]|nr:phosphate butyryltransferase [Prevotella sp.]